MAAGVVHLALKFLLQEVGLLAVGEETEVVLPQFEVGAHLLNLVEELVALVVAETLIASTAMVADAFAVVVLVGLACGDFQLLEDAVQE